MFSSEDFGGHRDSVFDALRQGAYVVLNATLSRRPRASPGGRLDVEGFFARRRFTRSGD